MENGFSTTLILEPFAMNGGDGPYSYAQNSHMQRLVIEAAKNIVQSAITNMFDPKSISATPTNPIICIADFGCSTGPNTFIVMQYMIEATQLVYQSCNLSTPEFHVFFNDQESNDFNTLFKKLPQNRNYFASGVPGSFRGRLFPRQSLHLVYSGTALNWISNMPKELTDKSSGAWNKGRIYYSSAPREVVEAYEKQYKIEFESFLHARAQEIASNGIMALHIPASRDEVDFNDSMYNGKDIDLLGECLMDMAKLGLVSEERVDNFNVPMFFPHMKDLKKILESNEDFSLEQLVALNAETFAEESISMFVSNLRAGVEGLIEKHFGEGVIDELFDRYEKKVEQYPEILYLDKLKIVSSVAILKRNIHACLES